MTGGLISGSDLGTKLGVSRAAIWQRIEFLKSLGVQIDSSDAGYQLTHPVYIPDAEAIAKKVTIPVEFISEVDSTNTMVLDSQEDGCLLTLYQRHGRGRRGRKWLAAPGYAVMMSVGVSLHYGVQDLSGLSVDVGVGICRYLGTLNIPARLKWPNDIWIADRKLGGILIEMRGDQDRAFIAIGFGMNLIKTDGIDTLIAASNDFLSKTWSDQETIALIDAIQSTAMLYTTLSYEQRAQRYREVSLLEGVEISVVGEQTELRGIAQGIDEFGRLSILTDSGIELISAGEVSVRPTE